MERDTLLKIVAWERAYRHHHDPMSIVELFQDFIDTGEIIHMGGRYAEIAKILIDCGYCRRPELRVVK